MKKIINTVIISLAASVTFQACSLDEYNPTSIPAEDQLSKFENWLGYQSMSYQALSPNGLITGTFSIVTEGGTDLWFAPKNTNSNEPLLYYIGLGDNQSNCRDVWHRAYMSIQQCSDAIRLAQYVEDGNEEDIKVLVAEAHFLRAYFFSVLVTYFGNVTLVNEDVEFTTTPLRSSYEELYGQMISDLKLAVEDLGVTPFRDNPARPTKKAALGILARVYAQGAGVRISGENGTEYSLTEDGKSYWQRAKEVADQLINGAQSYDAHLYEDFEDVFAQDNNKFNRESLFKAVGTNPMDEAATLTNGAGHNLLTYYGCQLGKASDLFPITMDQNSYQTFYGRMNSSVMAPSKYLVDCFDARYDKRWENSFTTAFTYHSFQQVYATTSTSTIALQRPYDDLIVTINQSLCDNYELDPSLIGRKIYPYVDLGYVEGYWAVQTPAKVWPKGEHSGDVSKLISVKNPYVHPYPIEADEDRFCIFLSKDYLSAQEKAQRGYFCVNIDDLFDPATGQYYTLYPRGYASNGGNPDNNAGKDIMMIFPMLNKFLNNFIGSNVTNAQQRAGDIMIMRMAEVYLIAAEATLMTGGSGAEAAAYLNVLRRRACRNSSDFNTATGMQLTTATMDDIFDEYTRELCGEFNRWALLRRHDALADRLQRYNKRAYDEYITAPDKYNFRPIHNTFFSDITNPEQYGNNGY